MKPTPPGWPRLSIALYYQDPIKAIDWLCEAFSFEVRLKILGEGGRLEHSEITYGEAMIMVAGAVEAKARRGASHPAAPASVGGANTQNAMLYVDSADAHCAHARASGAVITYEPQTSDYGDDYWVDRSYEARDLEGHHWWFVERIKTGTGASKA